MSGLAALFHRDGRLVNSTQISAMLAAVPYRGPDGTRAHIRGAVGLGHARMVMTVEDAGERQPLVSPRTGCVLVADARLDNRAELLRSLPGAIDPTVADGELLLAAYDAWGSKVVDHLLGDFAFVVWDPRTQRVVCGRDTSGQRPLFYRLDASTFAASSEIHQLLQDEAVDVAPNEERIRAYLVDIQLGRNEKDSAATFFSGIAALPAGHVLEVDATSFHMRRYWELQPGHELRYRADADYEEHFRSLLFQVVKDHLRTMQPKGALLSGGLDSASVVGVAHVLMRRGEVPASPFTAISAVYDGLDCDEGDLIRDAQRLHGFETEFVSAQNERSPRLRLEPDGFTEAPSMWAGRERDALLGAATRRGVRVLLTGEVADSCLSGSRLVFDSLLRHGDWQRLWRDIRAYRRTSDESLQSIIALHCLLPLLPTAIQSRIAARRLHRSFGRLRHQLLPAWLADSFKAELMPRVLRRHLNEVGQRRFASPAREGEYRAVYPPEVSRSLGAWPLEFRRPFADRRLHEFLLAIPPEQKYRPVPETDDFYAGSKWLLRRSMRGLLPESIRTRNQKTTFNGAFHQELEREWSVYEAAFGPHARSRIGERGYIDGPRFWTRLQRMRAGDSGPDFVYLLRLVELETWLRGFELPRTRLVSVSLPAAISPGMMPRLSGVI